MNASACEQTIFLTKVGSPAEKAAARLRIESLRAFGGEMSACPVWVFAVNPQNEPYRELVDFQVRVIPLSVPNVSGGYLFGDKVCACARAEELAPARTRSLVWMDPDGLVVQPPVLFDLGAEYDAALRPVHIRNVGLPPSEPLDAFWKGICAAIGVEDIPGTVESFVDGQRIRSYFNSHAFAINPALGLMRRWWGLFEHVSNDPNFQAACADKLHQIFLFQAILSALVATSLDPQRVRILPPTYNYPYHLQDRVPAERCLLALNDSVCFPGEDQSLDPARLTDIQVREPLRSWLSHRVATGNIQ